MAKDKRKDLGFDLDAAISTLVAEAIKAGAVPKGDPKSNDPWDIATAHVHGVDGKGCTKNPCRIGGLCYALKELVLCRKGIEGGAPFIDAADETGLLHRALHKAGTRYVKTLDRLRNDSERNHREEPDKGLTHDHEILCVRPKRILQLMTELQMSLRLFEDELRGLLWTFQLRQSNYHKSSKLLLRAVRQHLSWGGLKDEEIANLVPDGLGTIDDSHIERVRNAVKEPDARSIVPAELMGKLHKEKRIRTKKSKAATAVPAELVEKIAEKVEDPSPETKSGDNRPN